MTISKNTDDISYNFSIFLMLVTYPIVLRSYIINVCFKYVITKDFYSTVGMGDIDILAHDYCKASISRLSQLLI